MEGVSRFMGITAKITGPRKFENSKHHAKP